MSFGNNRGGGGGGYNRSNSTASNRSGGGRRGSRRNSVDPMSLPLEQGIICSLKESFGFIHCAERPEEIFFHYSEVRNNHPDDLQVDTEVEFRVGQSEKDPTKLAAYMVETVETGTVVWETEEEPEKFYQGQVERQIRTDSRGGRDNGGNQEGSIQVMLEDPGTSEVAEDDGDDSKATKGPMVRFRPDDVKPGNSRSNRLFRGDLVRFRIFLDRRTKQKYARNITLLQTEKERTRQERERKLLESATEEEGMVISLNKGYGFLKTNKRRAHVYFHYSNLDIPENEEDFQLKKGQEMKFKVVSETIDGQTKLSALNLECLPQGSVQFHTMVAKGVKGIITLCPRPPSAGNNSGYADDKDGSIRLVEPLVDSTGDGKEVHIVDVSFEFNDAPGGVYEFQQRGAATNGLWILEGDVVLFDVVKELADGSYQAAPTMHTLGVGGTIEYPGAEESRDTADATIRLAACSLVSRAEGIMHTLKVQGGYGFIHFAERAIDVHFQTYNLMPDELQLDLRRQLGFSGDGVKLEAGVGVQFDICAHGTVHTGARSGGRRRGNPHERENVKAHRILLLPASAVPMEKVLAKDAKAVVTSADVKQLYAGFLDLDDEVQPMSLDERHPLVARMIDSFAEESKKSHGRKQLVFRDVLSLKDDDVVVEVINAKWNGFLTYNHIPVAGMAPHPGRLCIRKVEADKKTPALAEEGDKGFNKKKQESQGRPYINIRFDKSSLVEALKDELPPGSGDTVICDVVQSRRTGKVSIDNLKIVERKAIDTEAALAAAANSTDTSGLGVVQNVVPKSGFGFISVLDERASRQELLFFSLSNDIQAKKLQCRKGDEVKFDIGIDPKTGKRMAKNVQIVANGTIPSKPAKNACRGIVLLGPTHTQLSDAPLRKKHSSDSSGGRWGNVRDEPQKLQADIHEKGVILLLDDKAGMFSRKSRARGRKRSGSMDSVDSDAGSMDGYDSTDDDKSVASTMSSENELEGGGNVLSHLPYNNGAIAIHGAGAAGGMDKSSNPRRGDIVTFGKARKGQKVTDIRVESRKAATMIRGRLENIRVVDTGGMKKNAGTAKFITATEKEEAYEINLAELVSCDAVLLKDKPQVEGILHEGSIYGLCRTADLYLESKMGTSHKERPKLNLSVKRNRGGKIMAQSMMGKGPDGTVGFPAGWTTRTSPYTSSSGEN